jgi:Zn-dependent protease
MNLGLALLLSLLIIGLGRLGVMAPLPPLVYLIQLNLGLLFFNLLPVPPLDGRVFLEFLPDALSSVRDILTRYGSFIFLGLIMIGGVSGSSPLAVIMRPFYQLGSLYLTLVLRLAMG